MKPLTIALTLFTIFFLTALTTRVKAQSNGSRLFTVNDTGDSNDVEPGDGACLDSNGKCTLRAAVQESNACCSYNVIDFALPAGSVINLTLGEITITQPSYIIGPGARRLTVQRSQAAGTPNFRIFRHNTQGTLPVSTIRGLTIKNGNVQGDGGAIYIDYQSSLRVVETTITGNTAAGSGGGIFAAGILMLTRSLVSANTANGLYAGGIVNINHEASCVISNSTLTNNTGGQGGAIYNTGNLLLVNDTISHNTARDAGSSAANGSLGTVGVLNTIIGMDNTEISSLKGDFTSLGNNLVTDARNSTGFVNGVNNDQVSNNNTINPLLGALTDNGGQTDTRALLASSPAIEKGNNCVRNGDCSAPVPPVIRLYSDQRSGHGRLIGSAVDVGAFESGSTPWKGVGFMGIVWLNSQIAGTIGVLTRTSDNEKQYSIATTGGNFSFRNVGFTETYIFEMRSKRANFKNVFVLENDFVPLPFPTEFQSEQGNMKITLGK